MAYAGRKALIKVGGTPVAMTAEATTVIAAGGGVVANTQYQITNATKRLIDINSAITVLVAGNPVTSGYTVDTLQGLVIFDTSATRTVTVTGKYVPTATAAECHEYSYSITQETTDTPKFGDEWNVKTPTIKGAEGSLSRWFSIDSYFATALISGAPVLIEFYPQDTLNPDRMWGILTSDEMSAAVDGAVDESVSFESTYKMLMQYTA